MTTPNTTQPPVATTRDDGCYCDQPGCSNEARPGHQYCDWHEKQPGKSAPQEATTQPLWSDSQITFRYHAAFDDRALMREMRDSYEAALASLRQQLAESKAATEQAVSVFKELCATIESEGVWEPVTLPNTNTQLSIVTINSWSGNTYDTREIRDDIETHWMRHKWPDGWQLMRRRTQEGSES